MAEDGSREVLALRSLHELMTTVNSAERLSDLLQTVVQGVVDVIGFRIAVIYVLDRHDQLEVVAVAGDDDSARAAMMGRRLDLAEFDADFAIADHWGSLRFVPHERLPPDATYTWAADIEPLDVPDAWHPMDALYCLLHDPAGRLLGILGVDLPRDGRRPGLLGRQVLEMYAVQAGLAIHHAQERARLAEQVALTASNRSILDAPVTWLDPESVLDHSLKPLALGYRCDRVWVTTFGDGDGEAARRGATHPSCLLEQLGDTDAEALEELAHRCWDERRAVVLGAPGDPCEETLDPELRQRLDGVAERLEGGQLLVAPLGSGTQLLGALVLAREPSSAAWTPIEAEGVQSLAHEISRFMMHERLYETERHLNAELHELDRYKTELMDTITHELKAPLTVIDGHIELLEESTAPAASVHAIRRGTDRLKLLVEDLLVLARVKDPHVPLQRTRVDLAAVVHEVVDLFSVEVRRRGLVLSHPQLTTAVPAWGDRDELTRAIVNVVGNAVKYTPDGGQVSLRLRRTPGAAVFSCTDTGIGIDPREQAGLFEEFNRSSDPAVREIPGSGLGLAIVKRIVDRHDGTITVESRLGVGSTFRMKVPSPPPSAGTR